MCDYKYTLSKSSASGFELKSDDIGHIYRVLNTFICRDCKISKSQAEMNFLRELSLNDEVTIAQKDQTIIISKADKVCFALELNE